jgi:uncharacterized protein (TIGR02147 family)
VNAHYRTFLISEFEKRNKLNPRYSLRAYAEFLDLDSGTLSQILKGRRKLPKTHWMTISKKLKLKKMEKQSFLQSLWEEQGIDAKNTHFTERSVEVLTSEHYFEIITEWEFAAALCLFDVKHFQFTVNGLIEVLGLSSKRANEIYAKLFQYGLVKIINQNVVRSDQNFESTDDVLSKALQIAHVNEFKIAAEKLQTLDVFEREFTSVTFAGNSKNIKKMKQWIRNKRQEFDRLFESKNADQIFQFAIQLYPISKKVNK